jgi:hypothetical protein
VKAEVICNDDIKNRLVWMPQSGCSINVSNLIDDVRLHQETSMPTQTGFWVKVSMDCPAVIT